MVYSIVYVMVCFMVCYGMLCMYGRRSSRRQRQDTSNNATVTVKCLHIQVTSVFVIMLVLVLLVLLVSVVFANRPLIRLATYEARLGRRLENE